MIILPAALAISAVLIAVQAEAPPGSRSFVQQAREACGASTSLIAHVDGIVVEPLTAQPGDLAGLVVRDLGSRAWMTVFHDPASTGAAVRYAPCLGAQLRLLHQKTADTRSDARWASVVFTVDPAYVPPRGPAETRWTVVTDAVGAVDQAALTRLVVVIPHEQVHAFQKRAGAITPRWFHEGHAEWVGRQVTQMISPTLAETQRREGRAALDALAGSTGLDRWGGVAVRREAMLRQLSPEDRRRAESDPSFVPLGPFTFGPGDLESDEADAPARYEAAWRQFDLLGQTFGDAPVRDWVEAVTRTAGPVTSEQLDEAARAGLGQRLPVRP